MRLEDTMRQKTGQLELLPKNRGEAHGRRQSGEVSTALKGTERSGTDDTLLLMEQVVEHRNAIAAEAEAAQVAGNLKSWWRNSAYLLSKALPPKWFDVQGLPRVYAGKLNWLQAAEILHLSPRQIRRWKVRYEQHGYDGLLDLRRRTPSQRRVGVVEIQKVLRLYREEYFDFNVKHFHEKLQSEHGVVQSYSWVKNTLQQAGLVTNVNAANKL